MPSENYSVSREDLDGAIDSLAHELGFDAFTTMAVITEGVNSSDGLLGVVTYRKEGGSQDLYLEGGDPVKSEEFSGLSLGYYSSRALPRVKGTIDRLEAMVRGDGNNCLAIWCAKFHRKFLLSVAPELADIPFLDVQRMFRALATDTPITTLSGLKGLNKILDGVPKSCVSEALCNAWPNLSGQPLPTPQPGSPKALVMEPLVLDMLGYVAHMCPRL